MAYVRACSVNDVPAGGMARFKVNGEAVVVYNLADGFHATAASCSHVFGPLARGKIIDGQRVQCPLHRAEFDIWRWEELGKLPDLIVPFKRDAYIQIVRAFANLPAKVCNG